MKTHHNKWFCAAALALACGTAGAQDAPLASEPAPSSDAIPAALQGLLSDSFTQREAAQQQLELQLAQDYRHAAATQEIQARLRAMPDATLREGLPQKTENAALQTLVETNYALSHFATEMLALPRERRQALTLWADTDTGKALIIQAYGSKTETRIAAAKALAKLKIPEADWLLVNMVNDDDREIELAAIDAVWDRKPTPEMIDAVWDRANYTQNIIMGRGRNQQQQIVTVRGRQVQVYQQDYNAGYRQQDAEIACDLLIHMNDPSVRTHLIAFLRDTIAPIAESGDYRIQLLLVGYGGEPRPMGRLIGFYKPPEAVPILLKVALSPNLSDWSSTTMNNKTYRYSSRISAGYLMLQVLGEDPKKFNLVDPGKTGRWAVEGAEAEETKFVDDLKKWWADHSKEFDPGTPPATAPR